MYNKMDKYYIIEKDNNGDIDVYRTQNVSVTVMEKLSDDFPVSVCKRYNSIKPLFVVYAKNAYEARERYERFIKIKFEFKGR